MGILANGWIHNRCWEDLDIFCQISRLIFRFVVVCIYGTTEQHSSHTPLWFSIVSVPTEIMYDFWEALIGRISTTAGGLVKRALAKQGEGEQGRVVQTWGNKREAAWWSSLIFWIDTILKQTMSSITWSIYSIYVDEGNFTFCSDYHWLPNMIQAWEIWQTTQRLKSDPQTFSQRFRTSQESI